MTPQEVENAKLLAENAKLRTRIFRTERELAKLTDELISISRLLEDLRTNVLVKTSSTE